MSYCSESALYAHGISRGSVPNPGRVLDSAIDDTFTLDVHGFVDDDAVLFRPSGGGDMPVGLAASTTYYVIADTEHTFRVASAPAGAAVSFTDAVDPLTVISPLPIAAAIAWASRIIDDMLPAHVVPIPSDVPVPAIVEFTCAELAAGKLLAVMGAASASLADTVDAARKRLERWAKGVPLPGPTADNPARTNLAAVATATAPLNDSRGWKRFGGL